MNSSGGGKWDGDRVTSSKTVILSGRAVTVNMPGHFLRAGAVARPDGVALTVNGPKASCP